MLLEFVLWVSVSLAQAADAQSGSALTLPDAVIAEAAALFAAGTTAEGRARLTAGAMEAEAAEDLETAAARWAALGKHDEARMSFAEALDSHEHALALHRRLHVGDDTRVAADLHQVGFCLDSLGRSSEALPKHAEALEIRQRLYQGDHPDLAASLNNYASCLGSLGRFKEALPMLEESLAMAQRFVPGDDMEVAMAISNVGDCLDVLGRSQEALARHEEALAMRQRLFPGDHPLVAFSLSRLANCLDALGRATEALPRFQEALAVVERAYPGDSPPVANGLVGVARCLDSLGRSMEAMPLYERALAMNRRLHHEDHRDVAACLNNVAACLRSLGRSAEALPLYEEALAMRQRLFPGGHPSIALSINNVASCIRSLGRPADALPLYEEALAMNKGLFKRNHPQVADSLNNLAFCVDLLGRPADALPLYEEALAMQRELFPGHHPRVAACLNNVASCLRELGRPLNALSNHQEALAMWEHLYPGDHPDIALSHQNVAASLDGLGRSADALPEYEQALAMWARLVPSGHPQSVHSLVGAAVAQMTDPSSRDASVALLEQAIDVIERTRRTARGLDPEQRSKYAAELRRADPYPVARRLQVMLGRPESAFAVAERGRSWFFLDLLEGASFDPLDEVLQRTRLQGDEAGETAISKLLGLLAQVEQEEAQLTHEVRRISSQSRLSPEERAAHRNALQPRFAKMIEERDHCRTAHARMIADVLPILDPATPERVCSVLEPGELLLLFAIDEEQSDLFVVDREQIEVVQIHAKRGLLATAVNRLRVANGARAPTRGEPVEESPSRIASSADLFAELIPQSVWDRLRDARRVIVIPDGALHRFPLEAIEIATGRTWLDDGPPIAYAPSASIFVWLRQRKGNEQDDLSSLDVLALGDPIFSGEDPRVAPRYAPDVTKKAIGDFASEQSSSLDLPHDGDRERFGALRRLPATAVEVGAVANSVDGVGGRVRVLLGLDATESNLYGLAPEARFLQLATHGVFDETFGQSFSALAFTIPETATVSDDGFLTLTDLITRWRGRLASCRMVVLSACDTQLGVEQRNEAPFALSFGFIFAGASSVVSSLWQVEDASTAELMADFHARLAKAGPRADRLAEFTAARKALKAKGAPAYLWAPFVYVGNPN